MVVLEVRRAAGVRWTPLRMGRLGGMSLELALALKPVGEVSVHEALEDAPMIGYEEVDKLVDDDEFAERPG